MNYSVAVVSPGLLPIPPVLGGSVETVIQRAADTTAARYAIDIYGPTGAGLPALQTIKGIDYFRFPAKEYPQYFKSVRQAISNKVYHLIQVENRPLFVPKTKLVSPYSKFILSLHSQLHIKPQLIKPDLTLKIFQLCDRILVYSKFMRDSLAKKFPPAAGKIDFIHLGTDPARFRPKWQKEVAEQSNHLKKKYGLTPDTKVVLFAGRIIPEKGVDTLVKAMAEVLKKSPRTILMVVGSSWYGNKKISSYIQQIRELADTIRGRIIFTNYLPAREIPAHFALADVFVCPSRWDEPFGLVNVEAMSCGVPVVASARGGIPEIVQHGINGYLVAKEDPPAAYAAPIIKLLKSPTLAATLGRNGRKKAEDYFNWRRVGDDFVSFYDKVLQRG